MSSELVADVLSWPHELFMLALNSIKMLLKALSHLSFGRKQNAALYFQEYRFSQYVYAPGESKTHILLHVWHYKWIDNWNMRYNDKQMDRITHIDVISELSHRNGLV